MRHPSPPSPSSIRAISPEFWDIPPARHPFARLLSFRHNWNRRRTPPHFHAYRKAPMHLAASIQPRFRTFRWLLQYCRLRDSIPQDPDYGLLRIPTRCRRRLLWSYTHICCRLRRCSRVLRFQRDRHIPTGLRSEGRTSIRPESFWGAKPFSSRFP